MPSSFSKNKRLAVCGSGLTFLVPENVRTGDLTYRIRGKTDVIIARRTELYPHICTPIARSVVNLRFQTPGDLLASRTEFKLDLYNLQMMSATSSFPPKQAEDEDRF